MRPPDAGGEDLGQVSAEQARRMLDPSLVRRVPRYGRFALTGVVLAVVVCAAATLLFAEPDEHVSLLLIFGVTTVIVAPLFALLGCAVALLAERFTRRR